MDKFVGLTNTLSQCDKCGSEVPSEDIDWDVQYTSADRFKSFMLGLTIGGGLVAAGVLIGQTLFK